jgi:hypothetical protein
MPFVIDLKTGTVEGEDRTGERDHFGVCVPKTSSASCDLH